MTLDSSEQLYRQARRLMPGGVNSPVRAFTAVGGTPRYIARAAGCHLTDVNDRQLIDYIGSWGAMIAGHAHPAVVEAVSRAAASGTHFGTCTSLESELAAEIIDRVPSVACVRMVNSGTEAVMSAVRLARACTGRELIVKFEGCYHGHADCLLVAAGSGVATLGLPDSPGVTSGAVQDTLTAPYSDDSALQALFEQRGPDIAAVIVEPVAGNMGVVPPADSFLQTLRTLTRRNGALLIFDEVMTGFRVARGGAQQHYGVEPDLTTLGKILGGGLPIGAYGGSTELMEQVAPAGPVYQAGTLSGNPLTMAAGLATLRLLDAAAYDQLEVRARRLADGLAELLSKHGVPAAVQRVGSMLTLFFGVAQVRNFQQARAADHARFARFFHAMLHAGVHLPPSGYEAWFLSLAHTEPMIERTLECAAGALAALSR